MEIKVYQNKNEEIKECKYLAAFYNAKSEKSYLIIEEGKQNNDGYLIARAFSFKFELGEQRLQNIIDDIDKEIIEKYFEEEFKSEREELKTIFPGIIVLDYSLEYSIEESVVYVAKIEEDGEGIKKILQEDKNNSEEQIVDELKKILDRQNELSSIEQQIKSREKGEDKKGFIKNKIEELFDLDKIHANVQDEISFIIDYLEKNNTTKDEYKEEIFELNIMNSISQALINNKEKITEEIRESIFLLCERSENSKRLEQVLKWIPKTNMLEFNNLVYELIKNFKHLFRWVYVKRIANYFYDNDNYKKALELFIIILDMILDKDKKLIAEIYNDIGCCYVELIKLDLAIQAFQKSVENDKHFAAAYNNWAYTLAIECDTIVKNEEWEKKLNEALSQIKLAVVSDDTDISFYINKVQIEYELEKYDDVLRDCEEGCKISKSYSECKTLIQMRILSILEKYELNPDMYKSCFDEIYKDMQTIYLNEKADRKYFYWGIKVYKEIESTNTNAKEIAFLLSLLEFNIDKVKAELVVRDLSEEIVYYTKLDSLYYILNDEGSETKYRIPLFDVNHMNDPNEGITLQEYILSTASQPEVEKMLRKNWIEEESQRSQNLAEEFTFLKSFSKVVDTLPMWVQYGDDGKGCCVKVDPLFFTNLNYQSKSSEKFFEALPFKDDYRLYNVVYINENSVITTEQPKVELLLKRVVEILDDLAVIYKNCDSNVRGYMIEAISKSISSIKYLFKSSAYEHEEEVRLIVYRNYSDLKKEKCDIKTTKQLPIPKVYVHSARPIQIKEIILGPKILDANDMIPYINMQLHKLNTNGENIAKITKSKIDYR